MQLERNGVVTETYYYRAPSPVTGLRRPVEMERLPNPATGFAGDRHWYQSDGLDSVVALTDASGDLAAPFLYDEYGRVLAGTPELQVFAYTGQDYDVETGLYHFYARYYDAHLGLWLTHDRWRGDFQHPLTLNKYNYSLTNPVSKLDYLGYTSFSPRCSLYSATIDPFIVILWTEIKSAYMTYTSKDGGYNGTLTLHIKVQNYYNLPGNSSHPTSIKTYSWSAKSGNLGNYDPINPATYIVDPRMRRRNDSVGRGVCLFGWCPLGSKWNEDGWGKERLGLKYESGEGSPYFIHGGNETRGTAGCIKIDNNELEDILNRIQSVGKSFELYINKDYSKPNPPGDWYEGMVIA